MISQTKVVHAKETKGSNTAQKIKITKMISLIKIERAIRDDSNLNLDQGPTTEVNNKYKNELRKLRKKSPVLSLVEFWLNTRTKLMELR